MSQFNQNQGKPQQNPGQKPQQGGQDKDWKNKEWKKPQDPKNASQTQNTQPRRQEGSSHGSNQGQNQQRRVDSNRVPPKQL